MKNDFLTTYLLLGIELALNITWICVKTFRCFLFCALNNVDSVRTDGRCILSDLLDISHVCLSVGRLIPLRAHGRCVLNTEIDSITERKLWLAVH